MSTAATRGRRRRRVTRTPLRPPRPARADGRRFPPCAAAGWGSRSRYDRTTVRSRSRARRRSGASASCWPVGTRTPAPGSGESLGVDLRRPTARAGPCPKHPVRRRAHAPARSHTLRADAGSVGLEVVAALCSHAKLVKVSADAEATTVFGDASEQRTVDALLQRKLRARSVAAPSRSEGQREVGGRRRAA